MEIQDIMEGIGCGLIGGTDSAFAWMYLGKPRKLSVDGIPFEIRTGFFHNTSQMNYRLEPAW
jgi:hypothetical protein